MQSHIIVGSDAEDGWEQDKIASPTQSFIGTTSLKFERLKSDAEILHTGEGLYNLVREVRQMVMSYVPDYDQIGIRSHAVTGPYESRSNENVYDMDWMLCEVQVSWGYTGGD